MRGQAAYSSTAVPAPGVGMKLLTPLPVADGFVPVLLRRDALLVHPTPTNMPVPYWTSELPEAGEEVSTLDVLNVVMRDLNAIYDDAEVRAELQVCHRNPHNKRKFVKSLRRRLVCRLSPVMDLLDLPFDEEGLRQLHEAVVWGIREGMLELSVHNYESMQLLGVTTQQCHGQLEVTVDDLFAGIFKRVGAVEHSPLSETMAMNDELLMDLEKLYGERKPLCHLCMALVMVWTTWEEYGLPPHLHLRTEEVFSVARLHKPSPRQLLEYVMQNKPVIITGAVDDDQFPPSTNFRDLDYLRLRCGQRVVKVKSSALHDEAGRAVFVSDPAPETSFENYLDMLQKAEETGVTAPYYFAKALLKDWLPELVEDIEMAPRSPYKKYAGCFGDLKQGVHMYYGCGKNATAIHFDPSENLLIVIEGRKTFTIFPPTDNECLYPSNRPSFANCGVAPFMDPKDMTPETALRWPLYKYARPITVELQAGDVFYLPIFWWHCVASGDSRNMILNWWCSMNPRKMHEFDPHEGVLGLVRRIDTYNDQVNAYLGEESSTESGSEDYD
eukprot:NODE_3302_length_2056_cov_23.601348.p1 GENE.NODE_3302_length_2056_cov_23.601348~~NODE_3302_length_2056_cov_23.601348.p1  ORF type:complete len:555 (-),score=116.32 NODE_3302_length_2056_cov_23.601348:292-1956(-)